jgi:hypothetical protein
MFIGVIMKKFLFLTMLVFCTTLLVVAKPPDVDNPPAAGGTTSNLVSPLCKPASATAVSTSILLTLYVYNPLQISTQVTSQCIGTFAQSDVHTYGDNDFACNWVLEGESNWVMDVKGTITANSGPGVTLTGEWRTSTDNWLTSAIVPSTTNNFDLDYHLLGASSKGTLWSTRYFKFVPKQVQVGSSAHGANTWSASLWGQYNF